MQRSDDTEEKAVNRLRTYHANVDAVVGYYKEQLVEVRLAACVPAALSAAELSCVPSIQRSGMCALQLALVLDQQARHADSLHVCCTARALNRLMARCPWTTSLHPLRRPLATPRCWLREPSAGKAGLQNGWPLLPVLVASQAHINCLNTPQGTCDS